MARRDDSLQSTASILGNAPAISALRAQIHKLTPFDTIGNLGIPTVLICGETGTGKGLVARVIHDSGPRAHKPFINVNCAAIPETLLEAELFGFEAGAFTDAKKAKPGLFEAASTGTFFLDEIEALPMPLQSKLLKVIEEKHVRRLGAVAEHHVDVKLVAATQQDLKRLVTEKRFRADLYHRLAVVLLEVPPLRERGEDIVLLAQHFLHHHAEAHGLIPKTLNESAEAWLLGHGWPGNVRELSHLMERVTLLSQASVIDAHTLEQMALATAPVEPESAQGNRGLLDEPSQIRQVLTRTGGNVTRAARLLGLSRNALRYRILRYGIERVNWENRGTVGVTPPIVSDEKKVPAFDETAASFGSARLVGRKTELSFLEERLDATLQRRSGVVFITGPPGIGKTRLVQELRDRAHRKGFQWLQGHYARAGSLPYQAWVEMVREYLHRRNATSLRRLIGPYVGQLAKLLPEVAEETDGAPASQLEGPQSERVRLFEGLTQFFVQVSHEAPLVLFLDDLQWAPSMELVHHLSRNVGDQRILMLAVYRDDELKENPALWRTVLEMNRERLFHPLPLGPLEQMEVAQLVSQAVKGALAPQLVEVLYRKTEGNPFFVEEVLCLLQERNAIVRTKGGWEVKEPASLETPESVKAVINERLERLGKDADDLLRVAAIIGREFALPLLTELVGKKDEEEIIEVLDRCESTRLVHSRRVHGEEVYTFAHDLMQEALYESIGPARRRRYHRHIGETMEKLYANSLEERADLLAHHFLQGNNLRKAADYAVKVGDRASKVYAWGRAGAYYQNALELMEELQESPRQRAEILEKLALATELGNAKGSLPHWEKALSLYEALGDTKKAASVHLRLAQLFHSYDMEVRDTDKAYTQCLKAIMLLEPQGDSSQLALAYTRSGFMAAHRGAPVLSAIENLEKGLALAERLGDAAVVWEAATSLGHVLVVHTGENKRGLEQVKKGYAAAKRSGDALARCEAAWQLSRCHIELRDAEGACRWAEEAVETSTQTGTFRHQMISLLVLIWASTLRGNTPLALKSVERVEQLAKKANLEAIHAVPTAAVCAPGVVQLVLGNWDAAEEFLLNCQETAKKAHNRSVAVITASALGWLYLERGDFLQASAHLDEGLSICAATGEKTIEVIPRVLLSEIASKEDDLTNAKVHLDRSQEILGNGEDWRGLEAVVSLAEGILSTAQKHWDQADNAFRRAVDINQRYHVPYEEAKSLYEWGKMYLARGGSNDHERGKELLDRALAIFQRCAAKKGVEKVRAALASL